MGKKGQDILGRITFQGTIFRPRVAAIVILLSLSTGVVGYMLIEGFGFVESFYMTIITVSTVGFREVEPLSWGGRIFTSLYILMNIGVFAYAISVFTFFVKEGKILEKLHKMINKNKIQILENHIILCGCGRHGAEVLEYSQKHKLEVVVIEKNDEQLKEVQRKFGDFLHLVGDATDDDLLMKAGIQKAKAIISSLPDDTDNLFVTLSARQLSSDINIISRTNEFKNAKKIELAGANHVIMPEQIGGFFMATLVSKPDAAEFFSFIANETEHDIGFSEISYKELPQAFLGKSIGELSLREHTGANIIGLHNKDGGYVVNPGPETILSTDSKYIVLGSKQQLGKMRKYLNKA